MRVKLIAYTVVDESEIDNELGFMRNNWEVKEPDHLAETAGRLCYLSFNRPNPKTRENKDYLNNVINQGHESVLAHASATFIIKGVSRSLTHERIRSRFLSFSEVSQRYVNVQNTEIVTPPAMKNEGLGLEGSYLTQTTRDAYEDITSNLVSRGYSRKQAREAARAVMPNAMETKIMVSGNLRAWRDFIKQRLAPGADAEIQELAYLVLMNLEMYAPNTFQDIAHLINDYEERTNR